MAVGSCLLVCCIRNGAVRLRVPLHVSSMLEALGLATIKKKEYLLGG